MWRTVNPKAKPLSLVLFSKHIILKAIIFMQDPLHDSVLNMRCSQCETEIDKLQFYLHFCQAHLVCEEVWRFARCIIMKGNVVHGVWVSCLTPTVIAEYLGGTDMCVDEREIPFAHSKTSGIQGWSWSADNSEWVWHKIIWGRAQHDVQYKSAALIWTNIFPSRTSFERLDVIRYVSLKADKTSSLCWSFTIWIL